MSGEGFGEGSSVSWGGVGDEGGSLVLVPPVWGENASVKSVFLAPLTLCFGNGRCVFVSVTSR